MVLLYYNVIYYIVLYYIISYHIISHYIILEERARSESPELCVEISRIRVDAANIQRDARTTPENDEKSPTPAQEPEEPLPFAFLGLRHLRQSPIILSSIYVHVYVCVYIYIYIHVYIYIYIYM